MGKATVRKKINKIARQIAMKYQPEKIILFGSALSGEIDQDSDIDLLVIKDDPRRFVDRVGDVLAMFEHTIPTDVLVYTPAEIRKLERWGNPFISTILNKEKFFMADPKLVNQWLQKADNDFFYAKASLEDELEFFDLICFHFQQAAEKYLKAYIIANNLEFRKIHDLSVLNSICEKKDRSFSKIKQECLFLQRFYIEPRYLTAVSFEYKKEDASQALKSVRKIRSFILERVK